MAVLDPRLLPLLETLAGAGADWLSFEIMDGVRRGREALEPEGLLRAAREKVQSRQPPGRLSVDIPVLAEQILGDDQIIWAQNYVAARLDGALADLDEGYAMIEAVADMSGLKFRQEDSPFPKDATDVSVKIVLIGQEDFPIDRGSIMAARRGLVNLKDALARWSIEARGKAGQ